jgi:hypothetical protein
MGLLKPGRVAVTVGPLVLLGVKALFGAAKAGRVADQVGQLVLLEVKALYEAARAGMCPFRGESTCPAWGEGPA